MCQKWMVIFLYKGIFNITDIKEATVSHTHSMDAGDDKVNRMFAEKPVWQWPFGRLRDGRIKLRWILRKYCHSGRTEADGYGLIPHPVPNISYCCAKR